MTLPANMTEAQLRESLTTLATQVTRIAEENGRPELARRALADAGVALPEPERQTATVTATFPLSWLDSLPAPTTEQIVDALTAFGRDYSVRDYVPSDFGTQIYVALTLDEDSSEPAVETV
jgi:hypothetical protein